MSEAFAMSYVLAADRFELIRDVVRAVCAQTIAERIELVLVCPSEARLEFDSAETQGLGAVTIVETDPFLPLAKARACGIQAARASLVYVGETHSFPDPPCLAALVASHRRGRYAVVAPVLRNANPARAVSWASLMVTYRQWLEPAACAQVDSVSTYNGCFRRDLLLEYGDRLAAMLEYGSGLDAELRARGRPLLLEPAARISHLNVARLPAAIADRILAARIWAAARARSWSRSRRLLYGLGAPATPALVLRRVLSSPQWAHHREAMPRGTLACLFVSVVSIAIGESAGYLFGAGRAPFRIAKYELDRARYA